jgi:hypothetical protein
MDLRKKHSARLICLVALFLSICAHSQGPQTIELTVDYNDGVEKRFVLPFTANMTVFDAMTAAQSNPHGLTFACDPKFPCSGPPANRFLASIDDVKNQGAGATAKNWQFWVNKVYSDQGFGVCKIGADDKVFWKFDTWHGQHGGKACK